MTYCVIAQIFECQSSFILPYQLVQGCLKHQPCFDVALWHGSWCRALLLVVQHAAQHALRAAVQLWCVTLMSVLWAVVGIHKASV
jgi:hypothetical protein